jgi:hypothetical protein
MAEAWTNQKMCATVIIVQQLGLLSSLNRNGPNTLLLLIVRPMIHAFPGFISKCDYQAAGFILQTSLHKAREERPIEIIHANEGLSSPSE